MWHNWEWTSRECNLAKKTARVSRAATESSQMQDTHPVSCTGIQPRLFAGSSALGFLTCPANHAAVLSLGLSYLPIHLRSPYMHSSRSDTTFRQGQHTRLTVVSEESNSQCRARPLRTAASANVNTCPRPPARGRMTSVIAGTRAPSEAR
ncbi:hypothetical protein GY45DRAFT_56552 [Cubamyces sp. BRFM 1775]|nr:hypothetical protein GY45DRAFT_56552 [Cubamyces sp. BRFM 1775]